MTIANTSAARQRHWPVRRVHVHGANIEFSVVEGRLVIDVDTSKLDPRFIFNGSDAIPAIRFRCNEGGMQVTPEGEWEPC